MVVKQVPFKEEYQSIRPLLDLYDGNEYEKAKILAKQILSESENEVFKILLQSFILHFEGYSRWDSSYDYSSAKKTFQEAIQTTNNKMDLFSQTEQKFMGALNTLHEILILAIDVENCLISSDANAMEAISEGIVKQAKKGLDELKGISGGEGTISGWLSDTLKSWSIYHVGVLAYSETMKLTHTPAFLVSFPKNEKIIMDCLEKLEEIADEEFYTELNSYYQFLKRHFELEKEHPDYLVLKQNDLRWLFSFWVEENCLNKIYDEILDSPQKFIELLSNSENKERLVSNIDEESLSDLFETVLGEGRMKNLIMELPSLRLHYKGRELELAILVRIFRYGISTISFETNFTELTVSEFRTVLSFSGPHSAQYPITWREKNYLYLSEVADDIVDIIQETFRKINSTAQIRFFSHLSWYGYVYNKRGIWGRENNNDTFLAIEEAEKYPDFNGLMLLQREIRSAIDDWISAKIARTKNLAPIRSHIQDFLVSTENHGLLIFLDDPKWIVNQYIESLETLIRLRCLILTMITIAGEILNDFVKETSDLAKDIDNLPLEEAEKRIDDTRKHLLPVIHFDTLAHTNIELIRGTLTSNYRDHAELLRAMMEEMNIHPMVEFLERRLARLSHHQNMFSEIASKVVDSRAREIEKQELAIEQRHAKSMELINLAISFLAIIEILQIILGTLTAAFNVIVTAFFEFWLFTSIFVLFVLIFLLLFIPIYLKRSKKRERTEEKTTNVNVQQDFTYCEDEEEKEN